MVGGAATGVSHFVGGKLPFWGTGSKVSYIKYSSTFLRQAIIGAAVGGIAAVSTGGEFAEGAKMGAVSSGIASLANFALHDYVDKKVNHFKEFMRKNSVTLNIDYGTNRLAAGSLELSLKPDGCIYGYLGIGVGTPGFGASLGAQRSILDVGNIQGFTQKVSVSGGVQGYGGSLDVTQSWTGSEINLTGGLGFGLEGNISWGYSCKLYCF